MPSKLFILIQFLLVIVSKKLESSSTISASKLLFMINALNLFLIKQILVSPLPVLLLCWILPSKTTILSLQTGATSLLMAMESMFTILIYCYIVLAQFGIQNTMLTELMGSFMPMRYHTMGLSML